jgi:toluene monooxygenase system protein E
MTQEQTARRVRRLKTWTSFGNLGRMPSEYEVVTHNMNHTTGPTPLEMGPNVHGNQWVLEHRDGIALKLPDWDAFRDPDQLTYRKYTHDMDEQETYVDGLLQEYTEARDSDQALSERTLDFLQNCLTPCRYLAHGLQMASAYVHQLAPSSYVGNCAAFQTADQLRRVQRVACRTRQLALAHPSRGFGQTERAIWEKQESWQPIRKAVEELLVCYDWDEAFVALNLVVKPVAEEIFLKAFGDVARENGDELDALINDNLYLDAERSRRWTVAMCTFAARDNAGNAAALRRYVEKWSPAGRAVAQAGGRLLAAYSRRNASEAIEAGWLRLLRDAGLEGASA